MKVLVIDNYDSFTFNLVQLIGKLTGDVIVRRNDRTSLEEIEQLKLDKIVISPGPGRPEDSKVSLDAIKECGKTIDVLGVCLGHQGIGIAFGGKVVKAPVLMHGKASQIIHDGKNIYKDVPQKFEAGRYHSLVIDRGSLSGGLEITAETADGIIMGVRHKKYRIEGIQFHPESVLTPEGEKIIKNWLAL